MLVEGLAALRPDLIGLQEVSLPRNTAQWLADQLNNTGDSQKRPYTVHLCRKTGEKAEKEGLAILSRWSVEECARLDLQTQFRVAQLARVKVQERSLVFVNAHLFWQPRESPERVAQVKLLLDWLRPLPSDWPVVIVGDFNGTPETQAIQVMREHFTSAYAARHGREPEYTCPTPLAINSLKQLLKSYALNLLVNHSVKPWHGTLDYIFVNQRLRALESEVILNRPAPYDPTLYPSDHFGLMTELEIQ
jgi:endonuclease/exonuclease/phosphatase family metal-dependent hydrolase